MHTRRSFVTSIAAIPALRPNLPAASRPPSSRATYDVLDYGALGDGSVRDDAAIAATLAACPPNARLVFPSGRIFRIGRIEIAQNLIVDCEGALFLLDGVEAGFHVIGSIDFFRIQGGTFQGSGVAADQQIAWTFGNVPDARIENVSIHGLTTRGCTVGVKIAGTSEQPVTAVTVQDSRFFASVGVLGGTGYGLQFTHGNFGKAIGCHFEDCQRHGLYFAEGKHYVAMGNTFRRHRSSVADGSLRVAFSISRSDNVTALGNVFDECHDGALAIDTDLYGTICRNVALSANTFQNSHGFDVVVGSTAPSEHGRPKHVVISGNTFLKDAWVPGRPAIDIRAVGGINVFGNTFAHDADGGTPVGVYLRAGGGASFTDGVAIHENLFDLRGPEEAYSVELAPSLLTVATDIDVRRNTDRSRSGVLVPGLVQNPSLRIEGH